MSADKSQRERTPQAEPTANGTQPGEDPRATTECHDDASVSDVVPVVSQTATARAPSFPTPVGARPLAGAPETRPVTVLAAGERIGDFEILGMLGRGAFGVVYLARQISLDREVALKVAANRGSEGRTMARLEHQHIVQVFSETVADGGQQRLLCMQLVPGTSLQEVIARFRQRFADDYNWSGTDLLQLVDASAHLPSVLDPSAVHDRQSIARMDAVEATAWIGGRLAEALDYAHHQGVLHRDIKPANILVDQYGRPMLADFNISQRGDEEGNFGGTLSYMGPEHLDAFNPRVAVSADAVTERSDIYSLGIVLHELLTGQSPFPRHKLHGKMPDKVSQLTELRREKRPRCSPGMPGARKVIEQTIGRCLEPNPSDRFESGADLAGALDGCRRMRQVEHALPAPSPITLAALRRPFLWMILFALLPHVIGSVVNFAYNHEQIIQHLSDQQRTLFYRLVVGYNLIVYPLTIALAGLVLWPVFRTWQAMCGTEPVSTARVDSARQRALRLPLWAAGLAAFGWIFGGILFPLVINAVHEFNSWRAFAHFFVSFTISGLIAMAYSLCGVHYVVLRVLYPKMWCDVREFSSQAQRELFGMHSRHTTIYWLAGSIALVAAILYVFLAPPGELDIGYRSMVVGLILLGGFGYAIAQLATRRMSQTLVALTGNE